jgi:hypothetical protein
VGRTVNPQGMALGAIRRMARAIRPWIGEARFEALVGLGYLGYLPVIDRPRTFNEKLLWLKLHHRDPAMRRFADKLEARVAAREVVPDIRLPELIGVYAEVDEVPFAALPDHAVLKSNHGSGHVRILKRPIDEAAVRAAASRWLTTPYGEETNEWLYANIPRRLLVERFLGVPGTAPTDYKVYVLNGEPVLVQLFRGRFEQLERRMVDTRWREIPVYRGAYPGGPLVVPDPAGLPPAPACLDRMLDQARRLARPFPFARADFYTVDGEPVFGELTFFPNGGHVEFRPRRFDADLGARLRLPEEATSN